MDEVKWYENCSLDSIKNIIKDNINTASRSFVAIGYYLKNIRDRELYLQDGYQSIWEFAQAEFGIGKSSASSFMSINDRFSVDGNSPILLELYKDFTSSKLAEMLTLSDKQLEQIKPETTIVEIREIKKTKQEKAVLTSERKSPLGYTKSVYPPDSLIASKGCGNKHDCFSCARICQIRQEDRYCVEAPLGHPFSCTTMNVLDSIENDIGGDCMFLNLELAYHRDGDKEPVPCCKDCKRKCGYACNKAAHAETIIEEQESVNNTPISANGEDESIVHERECPNCNYNDMTLEEFKIIDPDGGFPCNECDDKLSHWIPKIEQVEIVEADIIQTVPEDDIEDEPEETADPEQYTCQDMNDEFDKLTEYVEMYRKNNDTVPGRRKAKMRLDAMVLLDKEMRKPPVIEEPEPAQPELPKLKNNDKRKEWIDNYTSWPVWIDIPQTGERYYRYDFSNDTSFVIRVSSQHTYKDYKRTEEIKYAHEEYFLLGVKDKWIPGMPTFVESSTNKSAMVEHLKEIQKKGV